MEEMDDDGSGEVDFEEFLEWWRSQQVLAPPPHPLSPADQKTPRTIGRCRCCREQISPATCSCTPVVHGRHQPNACRCRAQLRHRRVHNDRLPVVWTCCLPACVALNSAVAYVSCTGRERRQGLEAGRGGAGPLVGGGAGVVSQGPAGLHPGNRRLGPGSVRCGRGSWDAELAGAPPPLPHTRRNPIRHYT